MVSIVANSNRLRALTWAKRNPKYQARHPQTGTQRFRTILVPCRRVATTVRNFYTVRCLGRSGVLPGNRQGFWRTPAKAPGPKVAPVSHPRPCKARSSEKKRPQCRNGQNICDSEPDVGPKAGPKQAQNIRHGTHKPAHNDSEPFWSHVGVFRRRSETCEP